MTLVSPPHAPQSILVPRHGSRSRKIRNRIATAMIMLAFVVALIPLVAVATFALAVTSWRIGLRRYSSTGS